MKDQKIIEGNKLIAEFMGAYYCNDDRNAYPDGYWMCSDEFIELPYNINDFKFHSSWDWLMSCIGKISNQCEEPEELDDLKYALLCNDINTAWIFVVDYLTKFNIKN